MNKVTGTVHLIEPTKTFGAKGFRKRVVVLEQDHGSFTNYIPVEFTKDACDDADRLTVGDEVEVTFRLNGRRWQKDEASEVRFFLNAEALSFVVTNAASKPAANERSHTEPDTGRLDHDDAPF